MKYRKCLETIGMIATCIALAGCAKHTHEWQEATCTTPKTCATCGETEGEALGHVWVDATCSAPKTCSVCGETVGEPLEHTLTEANYQQPATCEVCGETVGDVLTPAFEEYNVKGQFMELDKTYDYITCCDIDHNYKTVGQVTVTDYQTFASDDNHEAKEGYEWKTVEMQAFFSDENADNYGVMFGLSFDNYYDIIGFDNNFGEEGWAMDQDNIFTVNFNGQDYTECIFFPKQEGNWTQDSSGKSSYSHTWKVDVLLPVGYDGTILSLVDFSSYSPEEVQHIFDVADDNTLFFRLD